MGVMVEKVQEIVGLILAYEMPFPTHWVDGQCDEIIPPYHPTGRRKNRSAKRA
jgi:hypothetical protein